MKRNLQNQKRNFNHLLLSYNKMVARLQRLISNKKNYRRQNILSKQLEKLQSRLKLSLSLIKKTSAIACFGGLMLSASNTNAQLQFKGSFKDQVEITIESPNLVDLDGDGDLDILGTTFSGDYKYQENTGTEEHSYFEPAQTNPFGLSNANLGYTSASISDLDNDGDFDILVSSFYGDIRYFENTGTSTNPVFGTPQNTSFGIQYTYYMNQPHLADIDNDGDLDFFATDGYSGDFFYAENTGTPSAAAFGAIQTNPFSLTTQGQSGRPTLLDLDNDGDLDMFSADIQGQYVYYENTGTVSVPTFGSPLLNPFNVGNQGSGRNDPMFGDIDNDGDIDFVSKLSSNRTELFLNTGTSSAASFEIFSVKDQFNFTLINSHAKPTFYDLDNDGDLDALIGVGTGDFEYFENIGSITSPSFTTPVSSPFGLGSNGDNSTPEFCDIDNDGDADIFSGRGQGAIRFYENIGTASTPSFSSGLTSPFGITYPGVYSEPTLEDFDGDGDFDLLVSIEDGDFIYFENTGTITSPSFGAQQLNPFGLTNTGTNSDPTTSLADLDGDNDLDLLVGLNTNEIRYYENTGTTTTPNFSSYVIDPYGLFLKSGTSVSPNFVDLDGDNDLDVFVGAFSETIYFKNLASAVVLVSSITVQGVNNANTITTPNGTLQIGATVLPANAADATYTWSVTNGTGAATIDANGLLTATSDGTVTVTATANDASGETGTMVITISNQSVGIKESIASMVNMYPNPTNGMVTFTTNETITSIEIYSITGQKIAEFINTTVININNLPNGIYTATIKHQNGETITKKLLKK